VAKTNYPTAEALASSVLKVKGPGTLADVDDVLQVQLPADRAGPFELWAQQRIRPFFQQRSLAAVAAQYSYLVLYNGSTVPSGAPLDTFVVLRELVVNVAVYVSVGRFPPATWLVWPGYIGSTQGYPSDLNYPQVGQGTFIAGSDAASSLAALAAPNFALSYFITAGGRWPLDIVLPPEWGVYIRPSGVNTGFIGSMAWVERPRF